MTGKGRKSKKPIPIEERFWKRVDKDGPIPEKRPELERCWQWQGRPEGKGYGKIGYLYPDGVMRYHRAHRWSYENQMGPIPDGLVLDHLCENKMCVNPDHLEPVTSGVNSMRATNTITYINATKTHCPQGHEYTPENTVMVTNGKKGTKGRRCRTCTRLRGRVNSA